jgi:hypothetical protein
MADVRLKPREGGDCDLQINSTYCALRSLSVGNVAGMEISDCAQPVLEQGRADRHPPLHPSAGRRGPSAIVSAAPIGVET